MKIQILPSLLAADFGHLADEIARVEDARADALHLDIMDGHFVPNISFGPDLVALSQKLAPRLYRHVHLMLTRPDLYIDKFIEAGAQTVQIHVEVDCDVWALLQAIQARGVKAGLVLRPQTSETILYPYLALCDEVLFMTVNPGYGGQAFMAEVVPKIAALRSYVKANGFTKLNIMVDGGINYTTAQVCAAHGANQLVAGSFLFKQREMAAAIAKMREECEKVYDSEVR